MGYSGILSKMAQKKFDEFISSDRKLGEQLAKALDRLAVTPDLGKPLSGEWRGYLRYRSGRYRIIYRIEHSKLIVYVLSMDHRKEVYR